MKTRVHRFGILSSTCTAAPRLISINVEYLAALAQQAEGRKAFDAYLRGVPRMPVDTSWMDADSKV